MANRNFRHRAQTKGPLKGPTIISVLVGLLVVFGSWPGWLSGTSLALRDEAASGVITDWGPPLLVWIWSNLGASTVGPLVPYLIQQVAFWAGIGLATWVVSQRIRWWALGLPLASYFVDHLWAIHWVEKDGVVLATTVLSLGLFAQALNSNSIRHSTYWTLVAVFTLSLGVVARWYMLPVISLGATVYSLGLLWKSKTLRGAAYKSSQASKSLVAFALLFVFGLGAAVPLLVERAVVSPVPSYHSSSIKFLDIWRAQCLSTSGQIELQNNQAPLKFPPALVIVKEKDICTDFDPNVWNTVKDALPGVTHVRLPTNIEEVESLNLAWRDVISSDPEVLIYARFGLAMNLMGLSEYWMTLGSVDKVATGEARLTIARAPANLLGAGDSLGNILRNGSLYLIFLPVALLATLLAMRYRPPFWVYLGLTFPIFWLLNFVVIGPANDTRYISTGVGWSVIFAFLVVAVRKDFIRKVQE